MRSTIIHATADDLPVIYGLFEEAIRFQKANNFTGWKQYDKAFIKADIANGLLYKIVSDKDTACIFSICFSDALIWREREKGHALYLHRVVLNRKYAGTHMFGQVLAWAQQLAKERKLQFLRMDTWADNRKLIAYYQSFGFAVIETYTTPGTIELPVQHRNLHVALLERPVN
ncbi:Acetyltransferase (GNAT) family protein [Lacibacter cauensis]|uniref:Acetyltransferase (GNAT) family protein n=1 Tax=Lacibacter cauensis TaxID=510947 RepID=A0A562S930_9BACT|nr:GNAT family N-acetyltransferase [Lacibacter cauensis]TWI77915.1 Acetyltransferase (GNAT) family protein [Lacibacter cauensis]